jgi:hypothetical protein
MRYFTFKLTVALLTFSVGIAVVAVWLTKPPSVKELTQGREALLLNIPSDGWEPNFFKSINERASTAGLPNLRAAPLPEDDLEVRVWAGFGVSALRGLALKKASGRWSATRLEGIRGDMPKDEYQKTISSPTSGWNVAWRRLVEAGVLTLPDASAVNCDTGINDGISYVVEVSKDGKYRTYMYDNPSHAKCDEARQMLKIVEILDDEFNW